MKHLVEGPDLKHYNQIEIMTQFICVLFWQYLNTFEEQKIQHASSYYIEVAYFCQLISWLTNEITKETLDISWSRLYIFGHQIYLFLGKM